MSSIQPSYDNLDYDFRAGNKNSSQLSYQELSVYMSEGLGFNSYFLNVSTTFQYDFTVDNKNNTHTTTLSIRK